MINKVMSSVVDYSLKKPINWVSNTKLLNGVCKNYQNNNLKYIAALAVGSMVLKDGLGCYMYVKQSLNNKDIPEEKRKFVAALDLANGGLMILAQLVMFRTISNKKFQAKMFDKFFGKLFDRPMKKGYQVLLSKKEALKNLSGKEFNISFNKFRSNIQNTFGLLTTLVASTVLAKRVIIPFIATPLAENAKGLLYKNDEKRKSGDNDKNQDTFVPEVKK